MIEFRNVTKTFKKDFWAKPFFALKDVSFKIPEASMVGFLGANGAGKTTSLKILMQFIKADSGDIIFSEKMGGTLFNALSKIGYLPERPYFYPHLTGQEFTEYMGKLSDVPNSVLKKRINYWSELLSIDHALGRPIHGYSKGMLQRIGFVAVLLHNPDLLILDEPLSGLDPVGRKEIKDVMRRLKGEGKTIFFSSHIVSDIEETCRYAVVLEKGACIYNGEIEKLLDQNRRSGYEISFRGSQEEITGTELIHRDDSLNIIKVSENKKDSVIRYLLDQKNEIINLEPSRMSLEEIIYKIKS